MSFGPWGPERGGRVIKPDFFRTSSSKKPSKPKMTRGRLVILIIVLVILFFVLVVSPLASIYTDALWYNHLGFQSLFWKMLSSQVMLVLAFGAIFFILLYGNIQLARKLPPAQKIAIEGSPLEGFIRKASKWWPRGLLIFSIVVAFVSGLGWGGKWETVLKFFNHSSFGKTDPIFHKDIGFYLFSFPFFRQLVDWLISSLIFVFVVTVIVYLLDGGIKMKREPDMLAPNVRAHLSVLLGLIFIVKAVSYRLNMYELLFNKDGVVWGVGYTDASARLPVLWILTILSILCAAVAIANIRYKGWKLPVIAVGVLVGVSIIGGTLYPLIIQTYRVKPNERKLESGYLRHNIDLTREAYKLDTIESSPYAAEPNLDAKDIEANQATIENIRLWGPEPMLTACEQLQAIRQYYVFNDVDVDRYDVNGSYRQTLISAREINPSNLSQSAQTWVNKKLVYTHGYGICLAPSRDIGPEGNPNLVVEDVPPRSTTNIQVKKPEVYFGEATLDPAVVKTTEKEFDYPLGEKRIYTTYAGKGGVEVKSLWRKFLFAVRFRDVNLFFSGQVGDSSQVMYYRNVRERVEKCAPFVKFDQDPYIVVGEDGRLSWIVDGYTTGKYFPYSEPTEGFGNYVRNSVKAVVDAYSGKVSLYVIDPDDPVIKTYRKIFPQIFKSFEEMPKDLERHLRYPEDLFLAQANMFATYHMTDTREFYNKEDEWKIPLQVVDGAKEPINPYYVVMKLPTESREEMILMMPFTPHQKQNMVSWLAARMDPGHYGEMINYIFPSGKLAYGPEQVEGRIEQDTEISRQLSLWRQRGSAVIRGDILVIPIEESLIYVEPLYLQAVDRPIPQIKRVILAYGEQVVMEPTLEAAIARVFGGAPPTPTTPSQEAEQPSGQQAELTRKALDLYSQAIEAQKAGDWSTYGLRLKELGSVLEQLGESSAK